MSNCFVPTKLREECSASRACRLFQPSLQTWRKRLCKSVLRRIPIRPMSRKNGAVLLENLCGDPHDRVETLAEPKTLRQARNRAAKNPNPPGGISWLRLESQGKEQQIKAKAKLFEPPKSCLRPNKLDPLAPRIPWPMFP